MGLPIVSTSKELLVAREKEGLPPLSKFDHILEVSKRLKVDVEIHTQRVRAERVKEIHAMADDADAAYDRRRTPNRRWFLMERE